MESVLNETDEQNAQAIADMTDPMEEEMGEEVISQEVIDHHLSPLIVNKRRFVYSDKTMYRVYETAKESIVVEADSAHEAAEKSGVDEPYKIIKDRALNRLVLEEESIESTEDTISFDTRLPQPREKVVLFVDTVKSGGEERVETKFEPLSIGDLSGQVPHESDTAVLPDQGVQAAEDPSQPSPEGGERPLTPEEVDGLLNENV